jgi:hypothetical protein
MVQGIIVHTKSIRGRDILLEQHLEINIVQGYLYLRLLLFELAFCNIRTARLAKTRSRIGLPTVGLSQKRQEGSWFLRRGTV